MPNTITVTAAKANTSKPIEYLHPTTGVWQDSNVFTNVPAGIYNLIQARLKGSNPAITATWTQPVTVTNGGATTPVALDSPTGLSVVPMTGNNGASWNQVANASGYRLQRALVTNSVTGTYGDVYENTATSYADYDIVAGRVYRYRVLALGTGSYSNSGYSTPFQVTAAAAGGGSNQPVAVYLIVNSIYNDLGYKRDTGTTDTGGDGSVYRLQVMIEAALGRSITYDIKAIYGQRLSDVIANFDTQVRQPALASQAAGCRVIFIGADGVNGNSRFGETAQQSFNATSQLANMIAALSTPANPVEWITASPTDVLIEGETATFQQYADDFRGLLLANTPNAPFKLVDVRGSRLGMSGAAATDLYRAEGNGAKFHLSQYGSYELASLMAGAVLSLLGVPIPDDITSATAVTSGTSVTLSTLPATNRWAKEYRLGTTGGYQRLPTFTGLASGNYTGTARMTQKISNSATTQPFTVSGGGTTPPPVESHTLNPYFLEPATGNASTGWLMGNIAGVAPTSTLGGGKLVFNQGNDFISQKFQPTLIVGKPYKVVIDVTEFNGGDVIAFEPANNKNLFFLAVRATGHFEVTFTPTTETDLGDTLVISSATTHAVLTYVNIVPA